MLANLYPLPAGFAHALRTCGTSLKRTFPAHLPLYVCAIFFNAITATIILSYHLSLPLNASAAFVEQIPVFLMFGIATTGLWQLIRLARQGNPHPSRAMLRWLLEKCLEGDRPGNFAHALITLTPLMISFAALKEVIPLIHPFTWDATFMNWDRFLGFGRLPWQWLQPLLGHAPVTAALNFNYDFWFVLMFGGLLWQSFSARNSNTRLQFLLAFAFSWFIAGNLLAVVLSSAGPCFYGHLHPGHDPYAAQMTYLRETAKNWPVWSVNVQNMLWTSYLKGSGEINGISAMPSMHVVIAVLLALLGWRTSRLLGAAMTVFAALVVIGAIHLAWHYAVDVVAGIALAFVFWGAAGFIVQRFVPAFDGRAPGAIPATLPRAGS